ncbi:MAG: hypothetical protein WCG95_07045 [bacterium]
MKYDYLCPACEEYFRADRIDQKFCSTKCRNAFNNAFQAKLNAPYQKIAKNLKIQDELLEEHSRNPDILFHIDHFSKYGIRVDHAFRFYYDKANNLSRIVFVKYQLELVNKSLYKIIKL